MKSYLLMSLVGVCALIGASGQLFFKLGSNPFDWKKLALGLFLYGFATILYIFALRYGELTKLYPIIALSYLFVLILSIIFLNEKVTAVNIAGSILLLVSIYLMVG